MQADGNSFALILRASWPSRGVMEQALNHYGMGASIGRIEKHELFYGNPSVAAFGEVEVAYERPAFGEGRQVANGLLECVDERFRGARGKQSVAHVRRGFA